MALINKPPTGAVDKGTTEQNNGWPSFWSSIFNILSNSTKSGTTAARPDSKQIRWVGMAYFDTDLGLPVFLKSISPDVWVNGAGAPV